jgi:hypothetical protein
MLTACFVSKASSYLTSSTLRPLIPPFSLINLTASSAEFAVLKPSAAAGPVIGAKNPIRIGSLLPYLAGVSVLDAVSLFAAD